MTSEIRVGLLFFLGLGAALSFTVFVTDLGQSDVPYQIAFPRIVALGSGDPVTFNGAAVGRVGSVDVDISTGTPRVLVGFSIEERFEPLLLINEGTVFTIDTGTLGGATLAILTRGSGEPIRQDLLADKLGEEASSIGQMVSQASGMIGDIRPGLTDAINGLPVAIRSFTEASEEIRGMIAENRADLKRSIAAIGDMGSSISSVVEENRSGLIEAIASIEAMAAEIRDAVAENRTGLNNAIERFPDMVSAIQGAAEELRGILAENRSNISSITGDVAVFSKRLDSLGSSLNTILDQVAAGRGTVGRLVMEDGLYETAEKAVNSFGDRLDEIAPLTRGMSDLKFYTGLDGGYTIDTGASYAGAHIRIEPKPYKFYEGGVRYRFAPSDRDTADEDPEDLGIDFNLLMGWRFLPDDDDEIYRLSVKGGLIDSKIGGVLSTPLIPHRLNAELLVRAKDNEREQDDRRYEDGSLLLRSTLDYRIWKGIHLSAGVDDIIDDPAPFIGLRAEIRDDDIRNINTAAMLAP